MTIQKQITNRIKNNIIKIKLLYKSNITKMDNKIFINHLKKENIELKKLLKELTKI